MFSLFGNNIEYSFRLVNEKAGHSGRTITDNPGYFYPGLSTRPVTGKTHQFVLQTDTWHDQMMILCYEMHSFRIIVADFAERISFAEQWKLVAESSQFHFTLSRAHRAHFFQLEIRKKAGHFKAS